MAETRTTLLLTHYNEEMAEALAMRDFAEHRGVVSDYDYYAGRYAALEEVVLSLRDMRDTENIQHEKDILRLAAGRARREAVAARRATARHPGERTNLVDNPSYETTVIPETPTTCWRSSETSEALCGDYPAPCNCNNPITHDGH